MREKERKLSKGVNPCEKVNKHSDLLKGGEFLKCHSACQDLKKHCFQMSVKHQIQIASISITNKNGTQLVNRLDDFMLPVTLFANYVQSITMTEKFRRLCIPFIAVFVPAT